MATKQEAKKRLPGASVGVQDSVAMRDVVLAQPICPFSRVKMIRTPDGRGWMPDPNQVQTENCQLRGRGWWEECERLGHDPYWREQTVELVEPTYEEQPDGRLLKTGEAVYLHKDKRLNVTSVSPAVRHDSGRKIQIKMRDHGFKRLEEFGYAEVCQYFKCANPLDPAYSMTRIGSFCSYRHFALTAADEREEVLPWANGQTDIGAERRIQAEREEKLQRSAAPYLAPKL